VPGFTPDGYHDSFASMTETKELAEFNATTGRWKDQQFLGEATYDYVDK